MKNDDYPIVIGLSGLPGTGKSTVANGLVPNMAVRIDEKTDTVWDCLRFSVPCKAIVNIRTQVTGEDAIDRQLYQVMNVYLDLFGSPLFGGPKFEELVELTYESLELSMGQRELSQAIGAMCRSHQPEVFSQWMRKKINNRFKLFEEHSTHIIIIPDANYPEDTDMIRAQPNGLVIDLCASDEMRDERLNERDDLSFVKNEYDARLEELHQSITYDTQVDTTDLSKEDQLITVHGIIAEKFDIRSKSYAN